MGCKILTAETGEQVLYDSVTMTAFGVVHDNSDYDLQDFLDWLPMDARRFNQNELDYQYYEWLKVAEKEE